MLTTRRGSTIGRPTWVWGLPLSPMTRSETIDAAVALVERGEPAFFITANTHHAMLCETTPELREAMTKAAFVVADGAPLVRASRRAGTPLPERVAGSDLIFDLSERAAALGLRISLLGGEPGVAQEAASRLTARYPGLQIVGIESPPFRDLTNEEHEALLDRIRRPRPHLLFVAFGSPKGEVWVARNVEALGVPVCIQIGAGIDFAAGRVSRAPKWLQRAGLEWTYRMGLEPARLGPRYARNARFVLKRLLLDALRPRPRPRPFRGITPSPDRGLTDG